MEVLGWWSVPCGGSGFAWWFCWRCLGALVSLSLGIDSVGVHWKVVLAVFCWIPVVLASCWSWKSLKKGQQWSCSRPLG